MSLTTQRALRPLLAAADREALRTIFAARVAFDEPLGPYTSWKIGGPADAFVTARTQTELSELMRLCLRRKIPWWIIGSGSNVLVGDGGVRGIVIRLAGEFAAVGVAVED
ncbi:MAG: FAD-binding protein, partial [Candidatus Cybelea sp.]